MVTTTVGTREDAERLARWAVEQGLAACAHIEPITAIYRWQGALQQDAELRISFKTTAARWPQLRDGLRAAHPYELPQILALRAAEALPAYAAWVAQEAAS